MDVTASAVAVGGLLVGAGGLLLAASTRTAAYEERLFEIRIEAYKEIQIKLLESVRAAYASADIASGSRHSDASKDPLAEVVDKWSVFLHRDVAVALGKYSESRRRALSGDWSDKENEMMESLTNEGLDLSMGLDAAALASLRCTQTMRAALGVEVISDATAKLLRLGQPQ